VLNTLSRNFIEEFINPLMSNDEVRFSLTAGRMDGLLNGLAEHELDLVLTNKPIGLSTTISFGKVSWYLVSH